VDQRFPKPDEPKMSKFAVILPAAGNSRRFNDPFYKKPFANLGGRAVWLHSAERFLGRSDCVQLVIVIAGEDREEFQRRFGANVAVLGVDVCEGGAERADSVERALERVKEGVDFIAVHDAARPCIVDDWIDRVLKAAVQHDAAILASPVSATLKRVDKHNVITETASRQGLWEGQTPQVFRRKLLEEAYAKRAGFNATDDAQLVERIGGKVHVVSGSPLNIKITTKGDQKLAEQILKVLPKPKLDVAKHPFGGDDLWR
jgi:2-C-methyl-D-erythritol 4-phosphate cytidylyltransferase